MLSEGFIIISEKLSGYIVTVIPVLGQLGRRKTIHISLYCIRIVGISKRNLFTETFYFIEVIGRGDHARYLQSFDRRDIDSRLTAQTVIPGSLQTSVGDHSQCVLAVFHISPHPVAPPGRINRRSSTILQVHRVSMRFL